MGRYLIFFLGLIFSLQVTAQEGRIKNQSLFIYQFTQHVSWPEEALEKELVIGVYGKSKIYEELEKMASLKKTPEGYPIVIRQINSADEMQGVHILFIASSKSRDLRNFKEELVGQPILLVGERVGLAKKGASVNFIILDNDTMRFEVNPRTLQDHKLAMSQELLSLGFVVK